MRIIAFYIVFFIGTPVFGMLENKSLAAATQEIELIDLNEARALRKGYGYRKLTHNEMLNQKKLFSSIDKDGADSPIVSQDFVEDAIKNQSNKVKISRPIQAIFQKFWTMEKLTHVDLSNCKLTELPLRTDSAEASPLKVLVLNNNLLTNLPGSLAGFQNLEFLSVENNKLPEFPEVLHYVPMLKYASLGGNAGWSSLKEHSYIFGNPCDSQKLHEKYYKHFQNTQLSPGKLMSVTGHIRRNSLSKSPLVRLNYDSSYLKSLIEDIKKEYDVASCAMTRVFARTSNAMTTAPVLWFFKGEEKLADRAWESMQKVENTAYLYAKNRLFARLPLEIWSTHILPALTADELKAFAFSSADGLKIMDSYVNAIYNSRMMRSYKQALYLSIERPDEELSKKQMDSFPEEKKKILEFAIKFRLHRDALDRIEKIRASKNAQA